MLNDKYIRIAILVVWVVMVLSGCATRPFSTRGEPSQKSGKKRPKETHYQVPGLNDIRSSAQLEDLFLNSKSLFKQLDLSQRFFLTWTELKSNIRRAGSKNNFSKNTIKAALTLVDFFHQHPSKIKEMFNFSYAFEKGTRDALLEDNFIRVDQGYVTYEMSVMWLYLTRDLAGRRLIQSGSKITSGYRSPAYQFYVMSRIGNRLGEIFKRAAPPYYTRHSRQRPDISFKLKYDQKNSDYAKSYKMFCLIAKKYGFEPSFPGNPHGVTELTFKGIDPYYASVQRSGYIRKSTKRKKIFDQFYTAMKRSRFYPPVDFLKAILSLAKLESGFTWNPALSAKKKRIIKEQYGKYQVLMDFVRDNRFVNMALPENLEKRKDWLLENYDRIIDEKNESITEYDLFVWTHTAYNTFREVIDLPYITFVGDFLSDRISLINSLQYEPKTFGIFQIDINNMIYKMETQKKFRTAFPNLYSKAKNKKGRVDRQGLVKLLCGVESGTNEKLQSFELIILAAMKPRFENHFIGTKGDVDYFIIEHLMGDMSTHRVAIQKELNLKTSSNLTLDGDLSYYYPHSGKINYNKQSNSQKAMKEYCVKTGKQNKNKLIREICDANSWNKLQKAGLYRELMAQKMGHRELPAISSELYREKASSYIFRIRRDMEFIK